MDNIETVRVWLEQLVLGLVDNPEDLKLTGERDDQGVLYVLKVNDADNGKIIGRQGRMAKSIRNLLSAKGMKHQVRASLKIEAPELAPAPAEDKRAVAPPTSDKQEFGE